MTTDLLSIRDEIAQQDAKMDELLKQIMAPDKPRARKVVHETPLGIVPKPRAKAVAPDAGEAVRSGKKHPTAKTRRAAADRKQP